MMHPKIDDHRVAIIAALLFTVAASMCWRDAYESRGQARPLWTRIASVLG